MIVLWLLLSVIFELFMLEKELNSLTQINTSTIKKSTVSIVR